MKKQLSEEVKQANAEARKEALKRFTECYTPAEMMINRISSDFGRKSCDFTYFVEDENGLTMEAEGSAKLADFASDTAKKSLAKCKVKICRAVPKWYVLRNAKGKEAEQARSDLYKEIIPEVVEYLRLCTCGIIAINKDDIKEAFGSGYFFNEGGNRDCSPTAVEKAITGIYYNIIKNRKAFNAYECRVTYREKLREFRTEVKKRANEEAEKIVKANAENILKQVEAEAEAKAQAQAQEAEAVKAEAQAQAQEAEAKAQGTAQEAEAVKAEAEAKKTKGTGKGKAKAEKVA